MAEWQPMTDPQNAKASGEVHWRIDTPKYSNWQCHLFGSNGDGYSWKPLEGHEPNRFWRWMQFVCFGNRWVCTPQSTKGE